MPGLRVVEGADRLAVRVAFPWETMVLGVGAAGMGAAFLAPIVADGPAILTTAGACFVGVGLVALHAAAVRLVEGVVFDRRTGDCRVVAVRRGRRVVTRRPMKMLRRVEVRPNGLEGTYALAFEFRGEPPVVFPTRMDGLDREDGEAIAARVRAFLAGVGGANRRA